MMRAGDIIFVRGDSIISTAIKLLDKGKFTHVAMAVSLTHILEAQYFATVRITPFYFKDYHNNGSWFK